MSDEGGEDVHRPNADELRELLALLAVGALDPDEAARLRDEIADRPDLQAELAEHEEAATSLADAVAETPPPALRASVLAAIRDVPQAGDEATPVVEPLTPAAPVVPITSARRRRWAPMAAIAGVAAAAILGVVAIVGLIGGDDGGSQVADLVAAEDAVTITFEGYERGFRLVHSAQHGAVALVGENIPELADDQVYELWLIRDDAPEPMEIFHPGDDGVVEVLIPDMTPPADASFAITIEPPGGSDQPTGTAIASTV